MYDYYGFPKEAYSIEYGCKGHHVLAKKIETLLNQAQIECRLDDKRPYDHGSYIPLKLMYPEADIPVIQVSLHANLDADTHLLVGNHSRHYYKKIFYLLVRASHFITCEHLIFQDKIKLTLKIISFKIGLSICAAMNWMKLADGRWQNVGKKRHMLDIAIQGKSILFLFLSVLA